MRAGRRLFSKAFFTTKTTSNIFNFFTTRFTSLVEFNSEKKIVFFRVPLLLTITQDSCSQLLNVFREDQVKISSFSSVLSVLIATKLTEQVKKNIGIHACRHMPT